MPPYVSMHTKNMQKYDAMYAAIHAHVDQTACVLTYPYRSHYMPTYMSMYANMHAVVWVMYGTMYVAIHAHLSQLACILTCTYMFQHRPSYMPLYDDIYAVVWVPVLYVYHGCIHTVQL